MRAFEAKLGGEIASRQGTPITNHSVLKATPQGLIGEEEDLGEDLAEPHKEEDSLAPVPPTDGTALKASPQFGDFATTTALTKKAAIVAAKNVGNQLIRGHFAIVRLTYLAIAARTLKLVSLLS